MRLLSATPIQELTLASNPYINQAFSKNTIRAYKCDTEHFLSHGGTLPCSTDLVILYLTKFAPLVSPDTLKRRKKTISKWHEMHGFNDPTKHVTVDMVMKGIRREHGKPVHKATPLLLNDLEKLVAYFDSNPSLRRSRNKALILFGFDLGLRRSELLSIEFHHLKFVANGVNVFIPRSKNDQNGLGCWRSVSYAKRKDLCPVTSLMRWLCAAKISSGHIFPAITRDKVIVPGRMSDGMANVIIKSALEKCEIKSGNYSGHSLRRGFVTERTLRGFDSVSTAIRGRWKKVSSIYGYVDEASLLKQENGSGIL